MFGVVQLQAVLIAPDLHSMYMHILEYQFLEYHKNKLIVELKLPILLLEIYFSHTQDMLEYILVMDKLFIRLRLEMLLRLVMLGEEIVVFLNMYMLVGCNYVMGS